VTPVLLLVEVSLPTAAAWGVLRRLDPMPAPDPATLALRAGLALLLGAGACAVLAYGWLAAGGALGPGFAVADGAVTLALLVAVLRGDPPAAGDAREVPVRGRGDALVLAAAAVAFAVFAAAFVADVSLAPHGDWDAWAIWNQRARFLSRGGHAWRVAFDDQLSWSHPGYPLLVPAAVARLSLLGGEAFAGPAVAGLFTLAPLLVLFGAVARRAGAVAGATAALLLAATSNWLYWGVAQGADVPVAAFVLAALAALLEVDRAGGRRRTAWYALAGAFLGLAAWTKDEGLMFAAVFGAWALARGGRTGWASRAAALAAGAALPAIARIHFHLAVAPGLAVALTQGQTAGGVVARMLDAERWSFILQAVPEYFPIERALLVLAVVLVAAFGVRLRDVPRSFVLPAVGTYLAFLLVYAATPLSLAFHVKTSAPRVLLQPWPALLLALFALARPAPPGAVAGADPHRSRQTRRAS
jgi:hypothetical protein